MSLLLLLASLLTLSTLHTVEANIKGEFCTDISTYGPIIYHEGVTCNKTLIGEPEIEYVDARLHIKHNETKCKTEVVEKVEMEEMMMFPTMITQQEEWFQEWKTEMRPHSINHTKHKFKCEERERKNCETIWETAPDGTKTAVEGPCDIVKWNDCWKVPYTAVFTTMKSHKIKGDHIPYASCSTMPMPVKQMKWHVKKVLVSVCETVVREEWVDVKEKWVTPQLGEPKPGPEFKVPWQERLHREKCLQPGDPDTEHHQHAQPQPDPTQLLDPAQLPSDIGLRRLRVNGQPRRQLGGRDLQGLLLSAPDRNGLGRNGPKLGGRKKKTLDLDWTALKGLQNLNNRST